MRIYIHKIQLLIYGAAVLAVALLFVRMKFTKSLFLAFLVWNLFLAFIPLGISSLVIRIKRNVVLQLLLLGSWLLFLPNAPYIITDLKHLHWHDPMLWISTLVVALFALSGHVAGLYSMYQVHTYVFKKPDGKLAWASIALLSFGTGLGIYLGRILRFNSWDILHRPFAILESVTDIIFHPLRYKMAWEITVVFALTILLSYKLLYMYLERTKE